MEMDDGERDERKMDEMERDGDEMEMENGLVAWEWEIGRSDRKSMISNR
jgi:hypothetical protein